MGYNEQGIGYQSTDTSQAAAEHNKTGKLTIREMVRQLFLHNNLLTVEDVCRILDREKCSVQPRLTELKIEGYLTDSGLRRQGKYGTNIIVWQRAEVQEELQLD